ncbi:MAG: hypothetical protein JWL61_5508 [Gemmatimonadetes bacterium]|nr:hypothetical protein [Gemmatimonadota bacterium]
MTITNVRRTAVLLALVAFGAATAQAQTATQTVTFQVNAINQIAFVGSPSLTITTAVAGAAPTSVTAAGTWAVTTNQTGAKITASIPLDMATGLTLSSNLTGAGTSAGFKALSTTAVDVVTGLTKLAAGPLAVTYQLDATAAAGVIASGTRVVTYTLTGGT